MFCGNCGSEIPDGSNVCGYCGTPVNRVVDAAPQGDGQTVANGEPYPQSQTPPRQNVYGESAPSYAGSAPNSYPGYQANAYQTNGYQNQYQTQGYGYGAPVNNMDGGAVGLAVASMVLGIVALLISCCVSIWWLTLIVGGLGIVFGGLSLSKHGAGKGMAIAGLVCGIIAVAFTLVVFIAGAAFLSSMKTFFDFY